MATERLHPNELKLRQVAEMLAQNGYQGWEADFRDAEDAHNERSYSMDFPKALRKLKVKQKLHEGDRSHPRLVALDAIISKGLTYPGANAEIAQIEKMHAEVPYMARSDIGFNSKVKALEYSQYLYANSTEIMEEEIVPAPRAVSPQAENEIQNHGAEDVRTSNPLGLCIICGDETKSMAFIPCGHLCACSECASKVMRRSPRCPVCRCSALETIKIFLPT